MNKQLITKTFFKQRSETYTQEFLMFVDPVYISAVDNEDISGFLSDIILYPMQSYSSSCSSAPFYKNQKYEIEEQNNILTWYASRSRYKGMGSQQHKIMLEFLVYNNKECIGIEIPVYSSKYKISGHIDCLLYNRETKRYMISDFKPKAEKEDSDKVLQQLLWYRECLSELSHIPKELIKLSYFDSDNYYEFVLLN